MADGSHLYALILPWTLEECNGKERDTQFDFEQLP